MKQLRNVCIVLLALSGVASADPDSPAPPPDDAKVKAKEHADTGTRLYNAQEYDKAAEEYQQAYLLDPLPGYLYSMGQAQRLGGDCEKALQSYKAFLRTNPADDSKVRANIDRCEQYLKEHPPSEAGTSSSPSGIPIVISAPPPLALPSTPVEAPTPMVSRPWTGDVLGHVLVGGGVAVAATGIVMLLSGRSTIQDNIDAANYDQFASGRPDLTAAHTKQTIGVSGLAVGGALIVGGVVHYVLHTRPVPATSMTASIGPGQATLTLSRAF